MGAILIGSIIYLIIFIVAAYLIQEKVTREVSDGKLKSEYRGYE
jgi:hypothetical protein